MPVVPAGAPFQPAAPQTVKDPVSALAPSATVSWTAPNGNGDNNLTYEMRRTGGTVLYSGTGRSAHVTLNVSTTNQTFEVRARNKAGWGDWSPASNGVRGWQTPGAVTGLSSAATGANNQVRITFGAADGNGATAAEMKYYWRANGVTGSLNPGTTTVTNAGAFPNGQNVSVAVYAVSTVSGESVQGSSTSTTVNPYGPPTSPSVSCSTSGNSVNCSWSGGNANGRTTSFQVSGDWSTSNGGASGSHGFGDIGYSASRSLCVQAVQDGGATGARNCDSSSTPSKPAPTVSVYQGTGVYRPGQCTDSSCAFIGIETANFDVSSVTCTVYFGQTRTYTVPTNRRFETTAFYGFPNTTVRAVCNGVTGTHTWTR